jgi:hypothetical protein
MFMATAVAVVGIAQLPTEPVICCVYTSWGCSGVAREPTLSGGGRKSNSLHGVIGTNTERPGFADGPAHAVGSNAPEASATTTPAATDDQRTRDMLALPLRDCARASQRYIWSVEPWACPGRLLIS